MKIPRTSFLARNDGQSAMEALMALPFLLVVLLLGVNFGKAFLLKQRALVASRYAAWYEARVGRAVTGTDIEQAGYGGDAVRLAAFTPEGGSSASPSDIWRVSGGLFSGFIDSFLRGLRGGTGYRVTYTWRPLGKILPEGNPGADHFVIIEDWRCGRGGSGLSGANSIVAGLSWFFGSVFRSC